MPDTIVAVASALGPGRRGVVRIAGPLAHAIVDARFAGGFYTTKLGAAPARVLRFRAPRSYTGDDVAEVHTVSAPPLLDAIVNEAIAAGARAAGPGELTRRAFLAGRIDLSAAEAVMALIRAGGEGERRAALRQLRGDLARRVDALLDGVLDLRAHLEALLDFPDDEVDAFPPDADRRLRALGHDVGALARLAAGELEHVGPAPVVIAGLPSVGKSSLFNRLVGRDEALVSEEAGTTRDVLETRVRIDGVGVRLIDTAGAAAARDAIERAAQAQASRERATAALVLLVDDATDPRPAETEALAAAAGAVPVLRVRTKIDRVAPGSPLPSDVTAVSSATGEGLDALRRRLGAALRRDADRSDAPLRLNARHRAAAGEARRALLRARRLLRADATPDLVALELRAAQDELGAITGRTYDEALLDRIFGSFCIGK